MKYPNYDKSLKILYKLETYRFNLALFTASADGKEMHIEKMQMILQELEDLKLGIQILKSVLLSPDSENRSVIVWADDSHITGYDFIFEFVCAETAAQVLGLNKDKVQYMCTVRSSQTLNNYRMSYKEDFNITIADFKK